MAPTTVSVVHSKKKKKDIPKTPKREYNFPREMELLIVVSLVENKISNFQNTALSFNHVENTEHEYSKQHKPRKTRDKKTDRAGSGKENSLLRVP